MCRSLGSEDGRCSDLPRPDGSASLRVAHNRDGRFRLVLNAAVVTMLVEPDGKITSCSGAVTRMLGHDPEKVEGRPLDQLVVRRIVRL